MASLCKKCRHGRASWDSCGCTWFIRRRVGGREVYENVGATRPMAERALARFDATAAETVSEALDAWLVAKERDPKARHNSLVTYRSRAKRIREVMGDVPVRSLRPAHLIAFVDDHLAAGLAPATVQGLYACLTATLRHAVRRGVIRDLPLPLEGAGVPTPAPREHALTLDEAETVIERLPGVWGRVAELILLTGMRWGEAVALERGDIEGRVAHVRRTRNRDGATNAPKTAAGRRAVPLSRRAQAILRELDLPVGGDYRRAHDALVHAMGELHRPGMGWHSLRAAHASLLDVAGVSLRDSAARMGHGHHYAQTLAYGVATEAGRADALDRVRRHAGSPSGPSGGAAEVVPLARARRRRGP